MSLPPSSEPLVIRVMRGFKQDLLQRESRQLQEMARRWLSLERTLEAQVSATAGDLDRLRRDAGSVPEWRIFQHDRYRQLLAQLRTELEGYTDYAAREIKGQQAQLGGLGLEHARLAVVAQAPHLQASFQVLPVEAIQHMVGLAGHGSPLSHLLQQTWPAAVDGVTDALVRGTALGWNPRKTAREMQRGMAHGLNRVLTISRTESLRVYRSASEAQYRASGVVEAYRRLASKSDRTCAGCLAADGRKYPLGETFRAHPNCRCTLVPVVIGLPRVEWQTGAEWFARQDEATQRKILGPGRYDLWQDGEVDFEQFAAVRHHPVWGEAVVPASVKELV